jgi:aspartate aminotransferase
MRSLSRKIASIQPSATVAANTRAAELKRAGVDVVALTAGEPDFDTPEHVKEAAKRAIEAGKTKYPPAEGIPELREALAAKFARENGFNVSPQQTLVTVGGKQALFNFFLAVLDPGDEVIIIAPYWVSYPEQVRFADGVPVFVEALPQDGYVPDPELVKAAITAKTKAIVVNSPSNPTGAVYPRAVLEELAKLAQDYDLYLVSDEIYEKLIYQGEAFSPAVIAPEHTVTVNGAAKSFAMTGWRIGYAAGPAQVIKAMATVSSQSTTAADSIAQWAVLEAITNPASEDFVRMARNSFRERRDYFVAALRNLGLNVPEPQGAFYVMADMSPVHPDDLEATQILLNQAQVAVVPGVSFGAPGWVRMSYATSRERLKTAADRLASLLK